MTNEQQQVRDWMKAFGQECPEKPTIPSLEVRRLRVKLILEEALELCRALGFDMDDGTLVYDLLNIASIVEPNLVEIADGGEDLKVVTEGTLVACGLVKDSDGKKVISQSCDANGEEDGPQFIHYVGFHDPLFNEVMRSNNSKMWTREEFEHDWPEAKSLEDITGSWFNPHVEDRFVTKIENDNLRCYLVKDKDGKVIKSPSYSPVNLQPIIDEMSK